MPQTLINYGLERAEMRSAGSKVIEFILHLWRFLEKLESMLSSKNIFLKSIRRRHLVL